MDNSRYLLEQMEEHPHEWRNGMVPDRPAGLPVGYGGHDAGGVVGELVAVVVTVAYLVAGFGLGWWVGAASALHHALNFG